MYPQDINEWPKVTCYNTDFRPSLLNMANAITQLELWDWLRTFSPKRDEGFMFTKNQNVSKIGQMLDSDGHSGATFAMAMRCTELIAKKGFDHFYATQNK